MTELAKAIHANEIENSENRIRALHNATCKTKDIMPYRNEKFINMITCTDRLLNRMCTTK